MSEQPLATRRLYEIGDDLAAIERILIERGGEIPEGEEGQAMLEWLKRTDIELSAKFDQYVGLIKEFEARAKSRDEEAKRMKLLADLDDRASERLKARLKDFMEEKKLTRVDGSRFRVTLCQNSVGALRLERDDPQAYPAQFRKVSISIDGSKIRAALGRGETVEYASLDKPGTHVRIK